MSDQLPATIPPSLPPSDPGYAGYGPLPAYPAGPDSSARVRRFLGFLRRLWWVPVLTLILTVGAGVASVLFLLPRSFVSGASMWETEKLRIPGGALFVEDVQNYLTTQLELMQSDRLRELATARVQTLGTNAVVRDKDGRPMVNLSVRQVPRSTIFRIEASSPRPSFSQAFLSAILTEFLDYKRNVRKTLSGDTLASISDQVQRLERELRTEQEALASFERTNNLAILQEEGTVSGGYLARLKTQLSDLNLELQLLEATALEQDSATAGKTNATRFLFDSVRASDSGSSGGANAAAHQTALQELELLKLKRQSLSKYLRPEHPKMVKLEADIDRGQKLLDMFSRQSREQLASAQQAAKMKIASVQASIKEWETKLTEANARIAEAELLKLNATRTQKQYDQLQVMLQNLDINRNIDQETLSILEPASAAVRSYKQEIRILVLAVFAGLVLGLGIVFLVEVRDDRLTSLTEVAEKLTDNIVGQLPEVPKARRQRSLPLLEEGDKRYLLLESYRNLRSSLLYFPVEGKRPKTILITSALPNEGKSTVAANLARTLALGGSRVLLVDGDLRKGLLHDILSLNAEPGLSDLLRQGGNPADLVQTNSLPNLFFIARGGNFTDPGDLFLVPALDELLEYWRQEYDYVIIDSSPVCAADDAPTLAPKVDGTLFVIRRGFSRLGAARNALDLLDRRQARVLGLIFNRIDPSARSHYYYKYGEYAGGKKDR